MREAANHDSSIMLQHGGPAHRECPILGTRSVRRASGLLETGLWATYQLRAGKDIENCGSTSSPFVRRSFET